MSKCTKSVLSNKKQAKKDKITKCKKVVNS